jgi:hypothetical protein
VDRYRGQRPVVAARMFIHLSPAPAMSLTFGVFPFRRLPAELRLRILDLLEASASLQDVASASGSLTEWNDSGHVRFARWLRLRNGIQAGALEHSEVHVTFIMRYIEGEYHSHVAWPYSPYLMGGSPRGARGVSRIHVEWTAERAVVAMEVRPYGVSLGKGFPKDCFVAFWRLARDNTLNGGGGLRARDRSGSVYTCRTVARGAGKVFLLSS